MKEWAFQELLESIRQMREIRAGKRKPSRVTKYSPQEVAAIRKAMKKRK